MAVALALQGTGAVVGFARQRRSRNLLRRASALQRLNTQLANAQAKRAFITTAKLARASVLAGATREGALESSGVQGQLASVETQTEIGLLERKVAGRRNVQIEGLVARAGASQRSGQTFSQLASTTADVLGEFIT